MKHLLIAGALMMAVPGAVLADPPHRHGHDAARDYRHAQREYEKDRRKAEREYWKDRRKAEREYAKDRREAMREFARAERRWARGQHIPRHYLSDTYYVRDYGRYGLAPPPAGYSWVRPDPRDDSYYMVQLATGLIEQILGP